METGGKNAIFIGKFCSWAGIVTGLLPPGSALAADLTAARHEIQQVQDASRAVSLATRAAEKVEATSDPSLHMFRIEDAAKLAFEAN